MASGLLSCAIHPPSHDHTGPPAAVCSHSCLARPRPACTACKACRTCLVVQRVGSLVSPVHEPAPRPLGGQHDGDARLYLVVPPQPAGRGGRGRARGIGAQRSLSACLDVCQASRAGSVHALHFLDRARHGIACPARDAGWQHACLFGFTVSPTATELPAQTLAHRWRTARASGSATDSATSRMRRRVGSALAPAPAQQSTGMPRRLQAASRATCACACVFGGEGGGGGTAAQPVPLLTGRGTGNGIGRGISNRCRPRCVKAALQAERGGRPVALAAAADLCSADDIPQRPFGKRLCQKTLLGT